MRIEMICRHKPFKRVPCALDLQDGHAELTAEDGSVLFAGSYPELDEASQFPSFTQSIKYFGVRCDGRILEFNVSKPDILAIRNELDGQIIGADPVAAKQIARKAKFYIAAGVAAIIVGPVASLLSYHSAKEKGGTYYIWYGIAIFGIVLLGRGIHLLRRSIKAKRNK